MDKQIYSKQQVEKIVSALVKEYNTKLKDQQAIIDSLRSELKISKDKNDAYCELLANVKSTLQIWNVVSEKFKQTFTSQIADDKVDKLGKVELDISASGFDMNEVINPSRELNLEELCRELGILE